MDILQKQTVIMFIKCLTISFKIREFTAFKYSQLYTGVLHVASCAVFLQYFSSPYSTFINIKSEIKLPYFYKKYIASKHLHVFVVVIFPDESHLFCQAFETKLHT